MTTLSSVNRSHWTTRKPSSSATAVRKIGIFRPITIWPFPERELREVFKKAKRVLVAEHNGGQILLEVQRIAQGACPVDFIGRLNGTVITPQEILAKLEEVQ